MERKVRVAVVGVGFFGERHAKIYSELENVELVAVVDSNIEQAREVAKRYSNPSGTECTAFPDLTSLLGQVDAASIATPTAGHAPAALSLLDAGIHILIEKPITAVMEEADAICSKAKQTGKIVHVGHLERFNPALLKLKEYSFLPRIMECQRVGPFVERAANVSVVLDLMIHDIDIVLSLVAAPLVDVQATGLSVVSPHPDIAHARLSFANGQVADLIASRVAETPLRILQIFCDKAYCLLDYMKRELTVTSSRKGSEKYSFEQGNPLKVELAGFMEAVSSAISASSGGEMSASSSLGLLKEGREGLLRACNAVSVALRIMDAMKTNSS